MLMLVCPFGSNLFRVFNLHHLILLCSDSLWRSRGQSAVSQQAVSLSWQSVSGQSAISGQSMVSQWSVNG